MAWIKICENPECRKSFQRSKFNPYIVLCPECRVTKRSRRQHHRFGHCGVCHKYLEKADWPDGQWKKGMYVCGFCGHEYAIFDGGYWFDRKTMEIFYRGEFLGVFEQYGDLRRLLDDHRRIYQQGGGAGESVPVVEGRRP
jgi:hypothetical protein